MSAHLAHPLGKKALKLHCTGLLMEYLVALSMQLLVVVATTPLL
uniref:Uncharacterized protein n=1 Tax=Arundo donax TaxID=35708 RepID=A0A0A9FXP2_ARUDO